MRFVSVHNFLKYLFSFSPLKMNLGIYSKGSVNLKKVGQYFLMLELYIPMLVLVSVCYL